jgi:hypothetical protein
MTLSPAKTANERPRVFDNDDEYLTWINMNREGYVLTSNRSLTPRHTVIHRATCDKIKVLSGNAKPSGFTNRYIKVYAPSIAALKTWLVEKRPYAKCRECILCAGK